MKRVDSNIAILYFSRSPQVEAQSKRWFTNGGEERNRRLASALIRHSKRIAQAAKLPVYHIDETLQSGDTFGQKLVHAYQQVFDKGYEAVIAIGNDTMELSSVAWEEVTADLLMGRCVIGGTQNGGAYLIGLTRSAFEDCHSLSSLPWQSNQLYDQLATVLTTHDNECTRLETLWELNTVIDINNYHHQKHGGGAWGKFLCSLLGGFTYIVDNFCLILEQRMLFAILLRAPPRRSLI